MSGKKPQLKPLSTTKQLLLLESELNRREFLGAVQDFRTAIHYSKQRLASLGTVAALAGKVATVVPAISQLFPRKDGKGQKGKLSFLLNGMTAGTTLWSLFRSFKKS